MDMSASQSMVTIVVPAPAGPRQRTGSKERQAKCVICARSTALSDSSRVMAAFPRSLTAYEAVDFGGVIVTRAFLAEAGSVVDDNTAGRAVCCSDL